VISNALTDWLLFTPIYSKLNHRTTERQTANLQLDVCDKRGSEGLYFPAFPHLITSAVNNAPAGHSQYPTSINSVNLLIA